MHGANGSDISRITVSGHQIDIGDALKGYATEHLAAMAQKYFGRAEDIHCTFSRVGSGVYEVSVRVHNGKGMHFEGRGAAHEAMAAFNSAHEHVAKQLRRRKRELREDKAVNPNKVDPI